MNQDTAVVRGLRTIIQVIIAIAIAVVQVPGVPEVIYRTLQNNSIVSVPVISGLVAFVWNFLRKDVPNK